MVIKKIINWTAGGFFRSLGRILVYIVIGILIAYFCSKKDIEIPRILGIEKVYASEVTAWSTNQVKINTCNGNGTCSDSSNLNGNQTFSGSSLQYPLNFVQWRLKASEGLNKNNYYTLTFGYKPTPDAIAVQIQPNFKKTGDYADEDATCSQKYDNGWYLWTCSFEPREFYSSDEYLYVRITFYQEYLTKFQTRMDGYKEIRGIGGTVIDQTNILNETINDTTQDIINNQNTNTQSIINNQNQNNQALIDSQKVCSYTNIQDVEYKGYLLNMNNGTIYDFNSSTWGVTKFYEFNTKYDISLNLGSELKICFYDVSGAFLSCVDNASAFPTTYSEGLFRYQYNLSNNRPVLKICTNSATSTSDTLNDTNVSSDSSDMADFLNDFEFSNDGVIAQILTLPINFLEDIFEESYEDDLCFTLKGVQSCLPNGKILWNRNVENGVFGNGNLNNFKTFFNLIVGGYICYKLLLGLVHTTESALDPTKSSIEVLKL